MSAQAIFTDLLARGQLSLADIHERRFSIEESRGRHVTYRVTRNGSDWLFIKQAQGPESASSLDNEAAAYDVIAGSPAPGLRSVVPPVVFYDREASRLAVGAVNGSIGSIDPRQNAASTARWLGRVLAGFHTTFEHSELLPAQLRSVPPPWPFGIPYPPVEWLAELSPAQAQLVRLVQGTQPLVRALAMAHASWKPSAFIHGDVRPANIIAGFTGTRAEYRLVDLELAGWGDPAWDMASAVHCLLLPGFDGASWNVAESPAAVTRVFASRLPAIRRNIAELWSSYRRHDPRAARHAPRLKVARFLCARLLQTAYEASVSETDPPRDVLGMMQLAVNVASSPRRTLEALFGPAAG